jgi:ApaG protein
MQNQKSTSSEFRIETSVTYIAKESRPESSYYFFSYRIRVSNKGSQTAQLLSRHWIITDGQGHVEEVRGPGVIGQQPRINPGQHFEYDSACPLPTSSGSMRGSYQMQLASGELIEVNIPEFFLVAPQALH